MRSLWEVCHSLAWNTPNNVWQMWCQVKKTIICRPKYKNGEQKKPYVPLVRGQGENTGHIVVQKAVLLLAEVSHYVAAYNVQVQGDNQKWFGWQNKKLHSTVCYSAPWTTQNRQTITLLAGTEVAHWKRHKIKNLQSRGSNPAMCPAYNGLKSLDGLQSGMVLQCGLSSEGR